MNTDKVTSNLAKTALYYAKSGWHVFPLKAKEKTPLTPNGLHDATTDADTIRGWWERWPDANIGLNAGASGLLIVDFDIDRDDYAGGPLLKQLRGEHSTTTAQTGGGGFHLLYQQPEGEALGNSRGRLPTGVDVRGVGGYIVVSPSIHPNGNLYKWLVYPVQTPPQPLPGFLRAMLTKTPTPTQPTHPNGHYTFTDDLTKAAANLKRLRPGRADDYQEWVNVGMALCSLGAAGLGLWEDWSQQSSKYRLGECSKKWPGFTPGDGLGLGSLAHWADEDDPSGRRVYVNGNGRSQDGPSQDAGPVDVSSEPIDPLNDLLTKLAGVEDEQDALKIFAVDNVSALAGLEKADFLKFCVQLTARGVPSEWVRTELRPAVNGEKKAQATTPTWTDYIEAAHELGFIFRLNDLNDAVEVKGERMTDVHEATLLSKLHAQGLRNADVARRAFLAAAGTNRHHPVKSYLEGLEWDGQDHIATLAGFFADDHEPITYPDGTQRTVIHAFLRRWLVGAVAKVYDPMNAQNPMLILDGIQGSGKSYFAKWICPLAELHFEGAIRPDDKDYSGYLTTRWIWEVSELGATMRKADREALKAFITQQDATYRAAYGRYPLQKPALASFIGTVNFEGALLADPTGHRRFWPVKLARLDWGYSKAVNVNQLWAQAYALYRAGEAWRLTPEERDAHGAIVELYEVEDVMEGYLQKCFRIEAGNEALFSYTTEIIDTLKTYAGATGNPRGLAMQLSTTLNRMGLGRQKRRDTTGSNRWGYVGIAKSID